MPNVFISHTSLDKSFVRHLANDIERFGISVWLDEKEIRVGDSIVSTIEKAISNSDYVIIVLSKNSIEKPWVVRELNAAYALEIERDTKVILPIMLEKIKLPTFLMDKLYADFSDNYDKGFQNLLNALIDHDCKIAHKLETTASTTILDIKRLDGSIVKYRKIQTHRCIIGKVSNYIDALSVDGRISDLKVNPGKIVDVRLETGTNYVNTVFPTPLNEGDILERNLSCTFCDSFMAENEYWLKKQHYPSKNVQIIIKFPKGRLPKVWSAVERKGSVEIPADELIDFGSIGGKPQLGFFIECPKLFSEYVVRWQW